MSPLSSKRTQRTLPAAMASASGSTRTTPRGPHLEDPSDQRDSCGMGFVASLKRRPTREIVSLGLSALRRMLHRGAVGADPASGDGAGILIQIPDRFLRQVCAPLGISLPAPGRYAVGTVFFPQRPEDETACRQVFERAVAEAGLDLLGWREVPVRASAVGPVARRGAPMIRQAFLDGGASTGNLEDRLYPVRKQIENEVRSLALVNPESHSIFAITSLSSTTLIYKGQLSARQLEVYFPDLKDPRLESALALVHQRFSTNTEPSWRLAQPFRFLAHNGEINTLRGNVNWMRARERGWRHPICGVSPQQLLPVITPGGSDSAALDNAVELLVRSGQSLAEAMLMVAPEAWESAPEMPRALREFYRFQSNFLEPWDGPAALAFSDGRWIGASLDRNGLRPARYLITEDLVVLASEVGVVDIKASQIRRSGRLEPGQMLLVDTARGRVVEDTRIKSAAARRRPYQQLNEASLFSLPDQGGLTAELPLSLGSDLVPQQISHGYTEEELLQVLAPSSATGHEPVSSMGNDASLAVLAQGPSLLFDYFSQGFAQVTNPAIDSIRERLVMSLRTTLGSGAEMLKKPPQPRPRLELPHPILTDSALVRIRHDLGQTLPSRTLAAVFEATGDGAALELALDRLCREALQAVEDGIAVLVISDRHGDADRAPIPTLLALGAVHQELVQAGNRAALSLVVETGDARSVHHVACLIGHGAEAVNPYLGLATVAALAHSRELETPRSPLQAQEAYIGSLTTGLLKVMSKMGISTLQSYCGAQVFEAIGLADSVMARCFRGTPSRLGGADFSILAEEVLIRHRRAFTKAGDSAVALGGDHRWRHDGETHAWNPESVAALQHAVRSEDGLHFRQFTELANAQSTPASTLRHLLEFGPGAKVPLEEVEPATRIVRRFVTGAMSLGSISKEAHETLALAMNRIGGKSNTGEGGEDPARFLPDSDGGSRRSAIKQVASARFGVTINFLVNADVIQIKIAQGAKPGEGGQLPGHKVDATIAGLRHAVPGVELISPPPHHDIYSIEDLAELIWDLKQANPEAPVSVKLVAQAGVGTVAAGVVKAKADHITISGHDGGTGAAPLSSIKHVGIPWELGLAETQQTLVRHGLRSRVTLQTDGGLRTGRDVVVAALLGAEEFGFATAALVATGCILMRVCHLNSCPVGIATQDPVLRRRFAGTPEHVVRFFMLVAEDVREQMAGLGFRTVAEMVGRVDRLRPVQTPRPWKAARLDLGPLLEPPEATVAAVLGGRLGHDASALSHTGHQEHHLESALDVRLGQSIFAALERSGTALARSTVRNSQRAVGSRLSGEVVRRFGEAGLPSDSIQVRLRGVAGQSLGAWLAPGISLTCTGAANDYPGKGLSGGRLVVRPPRGSAQRAAENVIVGNVALYGATAGEAYFAGQAGERFAVRNSGARAVVEGIGAHGCEYMTGGTVLVLGSVGRNFAAGMTAGRALVLERGSSARRHLNRGALELCRPRAGELELVEQLLQLHLLYTGSWQARTWLRTWSLVERHLVVVRPDEEAVAVAPSAPLPFPETEPALASA